MRYFYSFANFLFFLVTATKLHFSLTLLDAYIFLMAWGSGTYLISIEEGGLWSKKYQKDFAKYFALGLHIVAIGVLTTFVAQAIYR